MPGARSRVRPLSADESSSSSASDEVSQLELHLQRQLEDDVARIFDESIFSDLEVVCGKLKILSHSCILKARTHKFYHKLEAILHVNIGRNIFDEIYSFISDAYTECNIEQQEKEIIKYLNENLELVKSTNKKRSSKNKPEEKEIEVFSTPNCFSPEKSFQKTLSASPSTELTKEYYALVPIDGNILDKELIEQDALSNAFKCINKSVVDEKHLKQNKECVKPTSLCIHSSHIPIPNFDKHSNICDTKKVNGNENKAKIETSPTRYNFENSVTNKGVETVFNNPNLSVTNVDKIVDPAYSPDSLITDEPSSSSDYLSAAYASPGAVSSNGYSLLNAENVTKMENIATISDSGLENTEMPESLNSNKDITLTDMSLTESTLHDMLNDDVNWQHATTSDINHAVKLKRSTSLQSSNSGTSIGKDKERKPQTSSFIDATSTKEEKQRQNEEIVILESSSLSSETGSWESVFPPKLPAKDLCEKFILRERHNALATESMSKMNEISSVSPDTHDELCPSLVQKSPFKSTSCFIDAASLADESDDVITVPVESSENITIPGVVNVLPDSSCPVPCVTKRDLSPNDWSESNDNDDSLEQQENKQTDSIQKDISPTIFEMTPITEDSLCANAFETTVDVDQSYSKVNNDIDVKEPPGAAAAYVQNIVASTPNNSMVLVGDRFSDLNNITPIRSFHIPNESPIISGGASVEDHLPQLGTSHSGSPMTRRRIENIPIVSGAYIPEKEPVKTTERPQSNTSNSFWVVDMSMSPKSDISECAPNTTNKLTDNSSVVIKSNSKLTSSVENCKSRSSVDSDSSERSTHKFYIDLSTLPVAEAPEHKPEEDVKNEKKNIFSMFIDLGNKNTTVKEMPVRLSSSLYPTKSHKSEVKCTPSKSTKAPKYLSSVTNTSVVTNQLDDTFTFERLESLCNDPNISITEIITKPIENKENVTESSDTVKETDLTIDVIEEETAQNNKNDLFVKLSDLDKPAPRAESLVVSMQNECQERMTRSIPDKDWRESSQTINARSSEIISSFHSENALSLNRLFPHLKNDFSKSMPVSLSSRTKSPMRLAASSNVGNIDEQPSDMSEMSSVQSSYCRSVIENSTTEENDLTSSLMYNCQSRLGQDLLRMFLEEIAPDVIVEVSGRRIKAHKCILSSRCIYFAGILSGGWVESAGNVISLPAFSYNAVHFALCHIYSGVSTIPDSVSIVELATIAAMLRLDGLKDAIMFTLKAKYCHHFHKPCTVCIAGVLECFPLSSVYGLDDLYRKCLRWITKHFHKVWPTKPFATLPSELLDKCYQEHVVNFTVENIIDTVYGCGIIVTSLANSRWTETVARLCRRLMNAAAQFAGGRLCGVMRSAGGAPVGVRPAALQALDECVAAAIQWAPADEACRAHAYLAGVERAARSPRPDLLADGAPEPEPGSVLAARAPEWRRRCEDALLRAAPRALASPAFDRLPPELRKRLRELGCAAPPRARAPPARAPAARRSPAARDLDIDRVRASFVPYAPKPQLRLGSVDLLPATKPAAARATAPTVRTTKAQQERAKYNLSKTSQPSTSAWAPTRAYGHAKPRYLEPRPAKRDERAPLPKMVSSSESSRNSSPAAALRPASRARTADPSTESLSDPHSNKYATYTKAKHAAKGSVESVVTQPPMKNQPNVTSATKAKTTKIPIYRNQITPTTNGGSAAKTAQRRAKEFTDRMSKTLSPVPQPRNKNNERQPSCSLMNATKSSQAKVVPKIIKDTQNTKNADKTVKCKQTLRTPPPSDIPIMERSGTFLKDEPMFGETTTMNIDE